MTGDIYIYIYIYIQTSHFANFEQVRIDPICSLLLLWTGHSYLLSVGKTCYEKQSNKNSGTRTSYFQ